MTDIQRIVDYTNNRLENWYEEIKRSYNVDGYGKCRYDNNLIIIDYTENDIKNQWSYGYYPDENVDFYFNVWSEQG